jgi:F420-dependent oxidoreductase-like protein
MTVAAPGVLEPQMTRPFFGYHMPSFTYTGVADVNLFDRTIELAQTAEAAGFDLVTVMDHFYQITGVGSEEEPMLEGYSALAAIAARTSRVKLATLVTGVTYRNPAMLAKTVTTLDIISKGRAILGLGAAWNESEHRGYGIEYPAIGEREDRLEEALTICKAMFTQDRPSFEGRYYTIDHALNHPRPIQPGGPKIMVGGGGEKRTLKAAARFADITNWFGSLEEAAPKLAILDRHCEAIGRDPSEILRTVSLGLVPVAKESDKARVLEGVPPERRGMVRPVLINEAADAIHQFIEAGFGGFIFRNTLIRTPEGVGLVGELIETMHKEEVPA